MSHKIPALKITDMSGETGSMASPVQVQGLEMEMGSRANKYVSLFYKCILLTLCAVPRDLKTPDYFFYSAYMVIGT